MSNQGVRLDRRNIGAFVYLAIAAAAITQLVCGCASAPPETTFDLGQEFTLAMGESASITGEQLKITFMDIIGDSRCPTDAVCIWQGEVSAQVEITFQESRFAKVLTQPGLTQDGSSSDFNEYRLAFNVLPYPEVGKEIAKSEYRLQLTVDKNK